MPEEDLLCKCCLACRAKGLTLADARCLSLNNCEVDLYFKKGRARRLATIQICLDLNLKILKMRFVMVGMLEGEWEDVQIGRAHV